MDWPVLRTSGASVPEMSSCAVVFFCAPVAVTSDFLVVRSRAGRPAALARNLLMTPTRERRSQARNGLREPVGIDNNPNVYTRDTAVQSFDSIDDRWFLPLIPPVSPTI
jgi:hypothetical protein